MHSPRPCPHCGVQFTPNNGNQKHCSKRCTDAMPNSARQYVCEWCGKSFPHKRQGRKTAHRFCSRECSFERMHAEREPAICKVWFTVCARCGDSFCARSGERKHCAVCADIVRAEKAKIESRDSYRARSAQAAQYLTGKCIECGGAFFYRFVGLEASGIKKRRYCSAECSGKVGRRTSKARRRARGEALTKATGMAAVLAKHVIIEDPETGNWVCNAVKSDQRLDLIDWDEFNAARERIIYGMSCCINEMQGTGVGKIAR